MGLGIDRTRALRRQGVRLSNYYLHSEEGDDDGDIALAYRVQAFVGVEQTNSLETNQVHAGTAAGSSEGSIGTLCPSSVPQNIQ